MFKWIFGAINALFLIWLIDSLTATADSCEGLSGEMLKACQDGTAIGAGLAVMMIFFLWAATDGILLMLRLVFRRKGRAATVVPAEAAGLRDRIEELVDEHEASEVLARLKTGTEERVPFRRRTRRRKD